MMSAKHASLSRPLSYILFAVLFAVFLRPTNVAADVVPVRHPEGLMHGFLLLRDEQDRIIANGEMTQVVRDSRVTAEVVFRFKDGSLYKDTTVYSQHGHFKLLTDHLIQKGPSFKEATDTSIDTSDGNVSVRYVDDKGKEKTLQTHVDMPADLSNGLAFTVLKDLHLTTATTTVSLISASPKPRLVKLAISPQGGEAFKFGVFRHKAVHFVVKVEIGGAAGVVAHLTGKQPPDIHVWILEGDTPTFLKSEGPLYDGGPIWKIQVVAPAFNQRTTDEPTEKSKH